MPKVKKKRVGFVIDMTPLVDITFLLLTFFMFTAKFKTEAESEQKFVIQRPEASADTSKVPETDIAIIRLAIDSATADTVYYYEVVNEEDREKIWALTNTLTAEQQQQALLPVAGPEQLGQLVKNTLAVTKGKVKFALDADKRIRYWWLFKTMDIMRENRATVFNLVTQKREGM